MSNQGWARSSVAWSVCLLSRGSGVRVSPGAPYLVGSSPDTWVTERVGYVGNNLGPNGLSRGSSTWVRSNSLIGRYRRVGIGLGRGDFYKPRQVRHQRRYLEGQFVASRQ